jgi:hypothetical protein
MIVTSEFFAAQLAKPQKRALYYLELPEQETIITSFIPGEEGAATLGGWGVILWGQPWGS